MDRCDAKELIWRALGERNAFEYRERAMDLGAPREAWGARRLGRSASKQAGTSASSQAIVNQV